MNSSDTRVATYLDDLARMLTDLDPGERDEVLAGIREHLDATLADHPDDTGAVDAALLRLGPPERVAAEARAGLPPGPQPQVTRRHPLRSRVAGIISLCVIALPALNVLVERIALVFREAGGPWPDAASLVPHPSEGVLLLPAVFPLWLVSVVVALVGPDLQWRTKGWLAALGPLTSLVVLVATLWLDPMVVSTPLSLVTIGAVLGAMAITARSVWRETSA